MKSLTDTFQLRNKVEIRIWNMEDSGWRDCFSKCKNCNRTGIQAY